MDGSIGYPVKVPRVSTVDHVSQRLCGGRGATHHRNHKSYRPEPQAALVETQNGLARANLLTLPPLHRWASQPASIYSVNLFAAFRAGQFVGEGCLLYAIPTQVPFVLRTIVNVM